MIKFFNRTLSFLIFINDENTKFVNDKLSQLQKLVLKNLSLEIIVVARNSNFNNWFHLKEEHPHLIYYFLTEEEWELSFYYGLTKLSGNYFYVLELNSELCLENIDFFLEKIIDKSYLFFICNYGIKKKNNSYREANDGLLFLKDKPNKITLLNRNLILHTESILRIFNDADDFIKESFSMKNLLPLLLIKNYPEFHFSAIAKKIIVLNNNEVKNINVKNNSYNEFKNLKINNFTEVEKTIIKNTLFKLELNSTLHRTNLIKNFSKNFFK